MGISGWKERGWMVMGRFYAFAPCPRCPGGKGGGVAPISFLYILGESLRMHDPKNYNKKFFPDPTDHNIQIGRYN